MFVIVARAEALNAEETPSLRASCDPVVGSEFLVAICLCISLPLLQPVHCWWFCFRISFEIVSMTFGFAGHD